MASDHIDQQSTVAVLAAVTATSGIRIGALMLMNELRHPLATARDGATLQELSGDRFELGIGAGWSAADFEHAGVKMDDPAVRIEKLVEAVSIIRCVLGGAGLECSGPHYGVSIEPSSQVAPVPRVVLGGGGRLMLEAAARSADTVNLFARLDSDRVDRNAAAADLTASAILRKLSWVREAAGDRMNEIELSAFAPLCRVTNNAVEMAAKIASEIGADADDLMGSPAVLFGDVVRLADDIRAKRDRFGVSYFVIPDAAADKFSAVLARLEV